MHAEVEDVFEGVRVGVAGAGTVVDEVDGAHGWGTEDGVAGAVLRGILAGRLVGGLLRRRGRVFGNWWWWWWWLWGLGLGLEARVDGHRHGVRGKVTGVESWYGHGNDSW